MVYDQMRDLEKRLIQKSIPSRRVSEQCHVSIKELSIFHTSDRSEREEAHVKNVLSSKYQQIKSTYKEILFFLFEIIILVFFFFKLKTNFSELKINHHCLNRGINGSLLVSDGSYKNMPMNRAPLVRAE